MSWFGISVRAIKSSSSLSDITGLRNWYVYPNTPLYLSSNRLQQPIPALIVLAFYEQTLALILLDIARLLPLSKNHMIVKETIQEELEKYFNSQ